MSLLDLFWTSVSGFLHALTVAGANGITPSELLPHARGIVDILPPIFDEFAERIEVGPARREQRAGVFRGGVGQAFDRRVARGGR